MVGSRASRAKQHAVHTTTTSALGSGARREFGRGTARNRRWCPSLSGSRVAETDTRRRGDGFSRARDGGKELGEGGNGGWETRIKPGSLSRATLARNAHLGRPVLRPKEKKNNPPPFSSTVHFCALTHSRSGLSRMKNTQRPPP